MSKRETRTAGIVHPAEIYMTKDMSKLMKGKNFKVLMGKLEEERLKCINHKHSHENR